VTKYAWPWDQGSRSWSLEADPRYQVKDFTYGKINAGEPGYDMFVDGHVAGAADTRAEAFARLEARYESEHGGPAYVPRTGDRVTVRRFIRENGECSLESEHTGIITELYPKDGGWYLQLDSCPDRIFTDSQFLGAGADGRSPATLVTEVVPAPETFGRQLSPDLVVATDSSQCIVLLVGGTGPKDPIRKVTVANVDALKAALDEARSAQQTAMAAADQRRMQGIGEANRARGRLDRPEAVAWLIGHGQVSRQRAAHMVRDLSEGAVGGRTTFGMTFDGTYWIVPPEQA
jgi:hypothetical protein